MKKSPLPGNLNYSEFGLWCLHRGVGPMADSHRHIEIEFNFVERGALTYLFRGSQVHVPRGRLAIFWAAIPHQIIQTDPDSHFYCFHLPLALLLQWRLPGAMIPSLMNGEFLIEQNVEREAHDLALVSDWHRDLLENTPDSHLTAMLEMEARLRRFTVDLHQKDKASSRTGRARITPGTLSEDRIEKVVVMMRLIADRFREELSIADIAGAANLHPKYAMTLFRATCGMTLLDYLTQYRLAEAQRALVMTQTSIILIALEAGFGSLSHFYRVFKQATGKSPKVYRESLKVHR